MRHFWYSNATDLKCWFWINLLVSVRFRIRLVWFTMCHYLRLWHFHAFTALTCIYSDHTVSLQCHYVWSLDELKELSKMFQLCLASESYLLKIPCVDEWKAQQWTPWDSKTNPNSRPLMTREIPLCGTTLVEYEYSNCSRCFKHWSSLDVFPRSTNSSTWGRPRIQKG